MSDTLDYNPGKAFGYVLVTGGTGLVGIHLIEQLLKEGKRVRALYHSEKPSLDGTGLLSWVPGDILDINSLQDAMDGVVQVYHCAAIISYNPAHAQQMFRVNIEGTANVVNACLTTNVKQLCFVSSVAALGRIRNGQLVNESMNWSKETSNSNYGKSKYLAEMEVWRGVGEGLSAVVVNPVIILGAGDWNKGSSKIFKSVWNEFPWYTEGESGFVDVKDLVGAMVQLTDKQVSGSRFIISGDNWSYRKLFTAIAGHFGKRAAHKKATPFLSQIVWRLEAIKSWFNHSDPLLTRETATTAQAVVRYDNSKLKTILPFFQYTPLEQTIERVCKELKEKYTS